MGFFFNRNARVTRIAAPQGAVLRSTATLMERRGWKKGWGAWAGPYATSYGTWSGKIEDAGGRALRVFIRNPPACLQAHAKWGCFHSHDDNGWWRIHLHHQPVDGDPNAVIRYVEQLIVESFRHKG
jgi:hypothetical protein